MIILRFNTWKPTLVSYNLMTVIWSHNSGILRALLVAVTYNTSSSVIVGSTSTAFTYTRPPILVTAPTHYVGVTSMAKNTGGKKSENTSTL